MTLPKILLLDEPTSGLDSVASHEVMFYLKEVAKKNTEQDRKAAYVRDASLLFDLDKSKLFAKLPQMISFRTNQYICSACRGLEFPTLSPWLQPDQATNQGAHFLRCDQLGQAFQPVFARGCFLGTPPATFRENRS